MSAMASVLTTVEGELDACIARAASLARKEAGGRLGEELRGLLKDLVAVRKRMTGDGYRSPRPPKDNVTPIPLKAVSPQNRAQYQNKNRGSERRCQRHDEGTGAWLPVSAFDFKDKARGTLRTWCRECTLAYQRDRYVKAGAKAVVVDVVEGDGCIGHTCPVCGDPFRAGERVQGGNLVHETCGEP